LIPAGLPWYFYVWVLGVKTPLAVLAAFLAGSFLLLRERRTMASVFFRVMVVIHLLGLSVVGPKWIRYMLSLLPFVFLTAGYALQKFFDWYSVRSTRRLSAPAFAVACLVLLVWPIADTLAWAPYYSLYLNALGGGRMNAARYFPNDEIYDLDTREVAQAASQVAPLGATLAAGNPMSVAFYLEQFGRKDIRIQPLYDVNYVPKPDDLILLQNSRRYFETQDLFYLLKHSSMPHTDIYIGGLLTSQIYRFGMSPGGETPATAALSPTGAIVRP
jgi:hypothetical protein